MSPMTCLIAWEYFRFAMIRVGSNISQDANFHFALARRVQAIVARASLYCASELPASGLVYCIGISKSPYSSCADFLDKINPSQFPTPAERSQGHDRPRSLLYQASHGLE
jgi:hypothetical protein